MIFFKRMLIVIFGLILLIALAAFFYMRLPQFGALPEGERLEKVKKSPNYKDGTFRNLEEKPTLSEGYSMIGETWKFLVKSYPRREPTAPLPSKKTNLKNLAPDTNVLVWFGHSSFFLKLDSINLLVDPVLSGNASPLPNGLKAYKGTDIYDVADLPKIDYLLLSHDHYDHLDYETIKQLQQKVKFVVCGLGAGAHFERWGFAPSQLIERDWNEKVEVKPNFTIFTESTHHFSGRGLNRGQSLWLSFFIKSPKLAVYYSGDGGYSNRFSQIATKFGLIDWAIMECGQYDKAWQSVHELPEEVAIATSELKAKNMVPVHNSKFTLAKHTWDDPLEQITNYSASKPYRLVTPMIGEAVWLDDENQHFEQWWKNIN